MVLGRLDLVARCGLRKLLHGVVWGLGPTSATARVRVRARARVKARVRVRVKVRVRVRVKG